MLGGRGTLLRSCCLLLRAHPDGGWGREWICFFLSVIAFDPPTPTWSSWGMPKVLRVWPGSCVTRPAFALCGPGDAEAPVWHPIPLPPWASRVSTWLGGGVEAQGHCPSLGSISITNWHLQKPRAPSSSAGGAPATFSRGAETAFSFVQRSM